MSGVPARLMVFPRPEICRPGAEVQELHLRAHDGARLRALLGRSAFGRPSATLLRIADLPGPGETDAHVLDWGTIDGGEAELLMELPRARRLEDRVLDVLRVVCTACSFAGLPSRTIRPVQSVTGPCRDELWIAERLLEEQL